MTLVVGATGLLGSEIVRRLRAERREVRVLLRSSSSRSAALSGLGAHGVTGDLKDGRSLAAACQGVDTVVSTASATTRRGPGDSLRSVDRDGQLALLQAARAAGVRRFVYVSVSPNLAETSALIRYKREVEAAVRASGMEWVILQPAAFMEVWLSPLLGWDLRAARGRIFGAGRTRSSLVSIQDVAAFAAAAAGQRDFVNCNVPVGGPEPISANEILALAQALTGRVFHVQRVPAFVPRALAVLLKPLAPLPASLMDLAAQMTERDDVVDATETAARLGIRLTSVRDFAIHAVTAEDDSPRV